MSFTKTLTATVTALYLGMGSAGAEESKIHGKTTEQHLSCAKEWSSLLTIVTSEGSLVVANETPLDDTVYPVQQLKLQLSKYSSVAIEYEAQNCKKETICVSEKKNKNAFWKLTCFHIMENELKSVKVVYRFNEELLDLSNPEIRTAAERKFCGYVKQAAAKYEKDNRQAKDSEVQKQLDLLK
ncbi:MAG: hypothetical protein AABY26_05205 [Nanoarchaeota archaeon]